MRKVAIVAVFACLTGACANPWAEDRPTELERWEAGWYPPSEIALTPRYCYRTLARVDCFLQPQPDAAGRRVGGFNAPLE
ncbi:MAG: hypothetical protein MI920_27485 [Kiloniellales bacterium]|nr:hypothetical protein [Kiloniellales bacterium]